MDPCPEIWNYEGNLIKGIVAAEPNLAPGAQYVVAKTITGSDLQPDGEPFTIPGSSFPKKPLPPLTYPQGRPDFFDRLRDVFLAIKRLFTGKKDNRNL